MAEYLVIPISYITSIDFTVSISLNKQWKTILKKLIQKSEMHLIHIA